MQSGQQVKVVTVPFKYRTELEKEQVGKFVRAASDGMGRQFNIISFNEQDYWMLPDETAPVIQEAQS